LFCQIRKQGHARRALDVDVVVALAKGHNLPLRILVQLFFEVCKAAVQKLARVQQRVQVGHDTEDELLTAQHLVHVCLLQEVLVYSHLAEVLLDVDHAAVGHQQALQNVLLRGADGVSNLLKRAATLDLR
jgi:hypothetical protein